MAYELYFWSGVWAKPELISRYQDVLTRLVQGEYKGLHLDDKTAACQKIKGYRLFTVRVNRNDRLLLGETKVAGKRALILLEEILEHRYVDSVILNNPKLLSIWLEDSVKKAEGADATLEYFDSDLSCDDGDASAAASEQTIQPVHFYNHSFIELNTTQKAVAAQAMPLLVNGAPGTGKSCVAYDILVQAHMKHDSTTSIVYVALSSALVKSIAQQWAAHPASQVANSPRVTIQSYESLLQAAHPELAKQTQVGLAHFSTWLAEVYFPTLKRLNVIHTHGAGKLERDDAMVLLDEQHEKLYEEFRIMSGYTEDAYCQLGARQSLYQGAKLREQLYQGFTAYRRYLSQEDKYDVSFFESNKANIHDIVISDESLDFSRCAINNLKRWATDAQTVWCVDSQQNLEDTISDRAYIESLYGQRMNSVELLQTYRCAKNIVHFANGVINLRHRLVGGAADKREYSKIEVDESAVAGEVAWFETIDVSTKDLITRLSTTTRFAIIVARESDKLELKDLFPSALVYTSKEIKGLEYDYVLLYKPLNAAICEDANKLLGTMDASQQSSTKFNRAKSGSEHAEYRKQLCELFTAVTRAQTHLFVLQDKQHANRHFYEALYAYIPSGSAPEAEVAATATDITPSTPQAWFEHLQTLMLRDGHSDQVQMIIDCHLSGDADVMQQLRKQFPNLCPESAAAVVQKSPPSAAVVKSATSTRRKSNTKKARRGRRKKGGKKPALLPVKAAAVTETASPDSDSPSNPFIFGDANCNTEILIVPENPNEIAMFKQLKANFIATNLQRVLSCKRSSLWLFVYKIDGERLIDYILNDSARLNVLLEILPHVATLFMELDFTCYAIDNDKSEGDKGHILEPAISLLTRTENGRLLLSDLINRIKGFNRVIESTVLVPEYKEFFTDTMPFPPPIPNLLKDFTGFSIILKLMAHNAELLEDFVPEMFVYSDNDGPTIFQTACANGLVGGFQFLVNLIQSKPTLFSLITMDTLTTLTMYDPVLGQNLSPLYYLCSTVPGQIFFHFLLLSNESLAKSVTMTHLRTELPNLYAHNNLIARKVRVLDLLGHSEAGMSILTLLYKASHEIRCSMTARDLDEAVEFQQDDIVMRQSLRQRFNAAGKSGKALLSLLQPSELSPSRYSLFHTDKENLPLKESHHDAVSPKLT